MREQFVQQRITVPVAVIGLSSITGLLENKDNILFKTLARNLPSPCFKKESELGILLIPQAFFFFIAIYPEGISQ